MMVMSVGDFVSLILTASFSVLCRIILLFSSGGKTLWLCEVKRTSDMQLPPIMHRRNVTHHRDYTKIPQDEGKVETDNIEDLRFQPIQPEGLPWSTILFVVFFFMGGTCCLVISFVIFNGYWDSKYDDRAWPAFILGCIMFIPGSYYIKVIVCASFGIGDHKFEDIPHFNS